MMSQTKQCQNCKQNFVIEPDDFAFYEKISVPAPTWCPECRIQEKFSQWIKNLRIIDRTCDKCGAKFQTNYPKEEALHILCKIYYQAEVVYA